MSTAKLPGRGGVITRVAPHATGQRIRNAVRVQARDCGQQGWVAFAGLTGSLPQAEHALPPVLPIGGAT
jgi:hypothetical protein